MAAVSDLRELVMRAVIPALEQEIDAFGSTVARAVQAEAPVKTGALRASISWRMTGPLSGEWRFLAYGVPVNFGHVLRPLGANARRTKRVARSGGHVAANPFLNRGINAASPMGIPADQLAAMRDAAMRAIDSLRK